MTDTFDHIIVGGGSAGSLLAYRLAEGGRSVCVLEAGPPDRSPFILLPAGFIKTLANPKLTWRYAMEPSAGTGGRTLPIVQGRTLGGSSAINGAIYNRGGAADFDGWAALGNPGWGFADILPYFRRTERRLSASADPVYRGSEGRLPIGTNALGAPVAHAFIASAVEQGLPRNADHNAGDQFGVGYSQSAIANGLRVSAARAFLHPARGRWNVDVRTNALVSRILIENGEAQGVEYRPAPGAAPRRIFARAGVILAAGTFNTPRLLQLSGIGPGEVLREAGVEVRHALAGVGENLRDHYTTRLVARGQPGMDSVNQRVQGWRLGREALRWLLRRPNALGISPALIHVFGRSSGAVSAPDLFLVFAPGSYREGQVGKLDTFPGLSCGACCVRPDSRGTVRIASADDRAAPRIRPNYLDTEHDRRVQVAACRLARAIISGTPMQPYVAAETLPGPDVQTDDEWLDFSRRKGGTAYHPVGTARMGPGNDAGAVVDPSLRVHGIGRLHVVDASVMPTLVSANTYAATLMIAEKGADMILGRAPLPPAALPSPPRATAR